MFTSICTTLKMFIVFKFILKIVYVNTNKIINSIFSLNLMKLIYLLSIFSSLRCTRKYRVRNAMRLLEMTTNRRSGLRTAAYIL